MSRKLIIALAAICSIGAASLAPTAASASSGRGHHVNVGGGQKVRTPGNHFRTPTRHVRTPGYNNPRRPHIVRYPHSRHPNYAWRRHYVPAVPVAVAATSYAVAPVASRCTCLTKEYTPEGSVLFRDVCTKEAAISPAPTAQVAPDPVAEPAPAR